MSDVPLQPGDPVHDPGHACSGGCRDRVSLGTRLTEERGARYGHPLENFGRIAQMWEPILGVAVTAQQVGLALIAVKLGRLVETPDDPDSIADLAGYAATLDMLAGRQPTV